MAATLPSFRIGVDVGGTFTDLVALDENSGRLLNIKVASSPRRPDDAVIAAVQAFEARAPGATCSFLSHSSTIATNALLGQVGLDLPRVALVTTLGFRDVLEIGRQNRPELYNLFVRRPAPLVRRRDRHAVRERMDAWGRELEPLDELALRRLAGQLRADRVQVVAVCFINSYLNPAHERRAGEIFREELPDISVLLSCDVNPEFREYERTSTTVVAAALLPLVRTYLERLTLRLREIGVSAPLYVMQSNGGMATAGAAAARPITVIESGPASGVIAAAFLGAALGLNNILSFDMGGTTAKAGTVFGGRPQVVAEFEAGGRTHSGRSIKGSGYPVRFPFVDLAEVSAGGGTIAWLDGSGGLQVGPISGGADPGPACYGAGGDRPTVTDANVVLGRLNPRHLLGGAMPIDAGLSRRSLESLAPGLPGLDVSQIAAGVVRIINTQMAKVLRIVSLERGHDPRRFTLMAFGGGGPLHACALAEELEIPGVMVPPNPGLFSAYGLLAADVASDYLAALPHDGLRAGQIEELFAQLEEQGRRGLARQGVAAERISLAREFDARYLGQSFELTVPAADPIDDEALTEARERFHQRHEAVYGYASRESPVELVAARMRAMGKVAKPPLAPLAPAGKPEPCEVRPVWFEATGFVDTPIYQREELGAGAALEGPAVVEQYDSCTLLHPGWTARVEASGVLAMAMAGA